MKKKAGASRFAQVAPGKDDKKDSPDGSADSMQLVTKMLGQRAQKAEDEGQAADKTATRRKLSHISGFISGKDNGSVSSADQEMTGKLSLDCCVINN